MTGELGRVRVEICVDDLEGALLSEAGGADRVEVCAGLSEGGVTPSIGLVGCVLGRVRSLGVQVMIRPRGGDFVLDGADLDVMRADIAAIRALPHAPGVQVGFVFGALTASGEVDEAAVGALAAACGDAPTTFHRAFDAVPNQARALETLIAHGIGRVLTSGGRASAGEGRAELAALVRQGGARIAVLAGGGVRAHNVAALVANTGVREVHLRAMREAPGRPPCTSGAAVEAVIRAVRDVA